MSNRSQRSTFTPPALLPATVPGLAQPAGPAPVNPMCEIPDSAKLAAQAEKVGAAGAVQLRWRTW